MPLTPAALALQPQLDQALRYYGDLAHEHVKLTRLLEAAERDLAVVKELYKRALEAPAPAADGENLPEALPAQDQAHG